MSQNVERLKELLFNSETLALRDLAERFETLSLQETRARDEIRQLIDTLVRADHSTRDDLMRRIDGLSESDTRAREQLAHRIEAIASDETQARADLRRKLDEVYARAGSNEAMAASVSEIIDEALRRAEIANHAELSRSIAPLVVTTIKSELRNSQDEMVEALYPITGRLVKSYVASALKDLTDQMNRRLEQNAVMLRLQSLTTGRSVGELALAGARAFDIKALYLIRRGSGELVAHWPESSVGGREHAMSGVLAAVNEFANEAFSADQSSLRQIDIGDEEVYLRGSPVYLLAARCAGDAPQGVERLLDDAFLSAVERQHKIDAGPQSQQTERVKTAALAELGISLQTQIAEQIDEVRRPSGFGPLKFLAALIVLPLLAMLAWNWYVDARITATRTASEQVIAADPAMLGYPTHVDVSSRGKVLTVSGLTPSQPAKERIINGLEQAMPGVTIRDKLAVVAGSGIVVPDLTPEIDRVRSEINSTIGDLTRTVLQRNGKSADQRLKQAAADIARVGVVSDVATDIESAKLIASDLTAIQNQSDTLLRKFDPDPARAASQAAQYHALAQRLEATAETIVRLSGPKTAGAANPKSARPADARSSDVPPLDAAIEQFAAGAERVAALSASLAIAKALRPEPAAALPPPPPPAAEPTARDRLEAFTRAHAVFFGSSVDYRDAAQASVTLTKLAELMRGSATLVRVVGYTDEVGAQQRNSQLAVERADRVRRDLLALGVPAGQIVIVGRANAIDLSELRGAQSPNRRVEFELGFEGETAP